MLGKRYFIGLCSFHHNFFSFCMYVTIGTTFCFFFLVLHLYTYILVHNSVVRFIISVDLVFDSHIMHQVVIVTAQFGVCTKCTVDVYFILIFYCHKNSEIPLFCKHLHGCHICDTLQKL